MNANLFLQYIRDILLEPTAQAKLRTTKEIVVSRDPPQPGVGYYRIYRGDDKIVLSPELIALPEVALFDLAAFLLDEINPTKRPPQTEAVPAKTVDPQEAAVLKAVPCYLVESFLGDAPEIGGGCQSPEKARALLVSGGASTPPPVGAADETLQKQGSQADEASATLCEAFRGLAKLPGMGPRLTASLLISTWIGANSRTAPASLRGRFIQELQEQATTIRERWQHVWSNPNPKALADRIRRSAALHESQ
jgi:hypothetical protein